MEMVSPTTPTLEEFVDEDSNLNNQPVEYREYENPLNKEKELITPPTICNFLRSATLETINFIFGNLDL